MDAQRAPRPPFLRLALTCMAALLLLGFASGWLSNSGYGNAWFAALRKPAWLPPAWIFPVVWTPLYLLQGLALALVLNEPRSRLRRVALIAFAVQFLLNLLWSPIFFGAHQPRLALYVLAAILGVALATTLRFSRLRGLAGWLMVPYLAWLCFAAVLNLRIIALNPRVDVITV